MIAWKTSINVMDINTILIISQDQKTSAVWELLFRQKNCLVVNEEVPQDAVQTCRLLSPSLIILDLELSLHDRIELCRSLRSTTSGALLLLTPSDSMQNIFEYYHAGVDEHIATPISPMALLVKSMAWLVKQESAATRFYKS